MIQLDGSVIVGLSGNHATLHAFIFLVQVARKSRGCYEAACYLSSGTGDLVGNTV